MSNKYCKLVMVTENNNNKYYIMDLKDDGLIHIEYGRVDLTSTKLTKPSNKWNSIYNEKLKKGYKDITDLVTEIIIKDDKENNLVDILDKKVDEFIKLMDKYTNGLTSQVYSVTYKNVTKKQIEEAQNILNEISTIDISNETLINTKLIDLYTVIPRKMKNVRQEILPHISLEERLQKEQDNIDAMSSQVEIHKKENNKGENTLLNILGITMSTSNKINKEIQYLIDQINKTNNKIEAIFEINNPNENKIYNDWLKNQNNKNSRILIHGTRCSSVLSILKQGLKIRPSGNFQFSGKVYGDGNYFSEVVSKSLNYTGYDKDKVLLVYEVHTGNPFIYDGWYRGNSFKLCYDELRKRNYDSTYVKAGHGLLNSEIITYKENQNKIKYIIWLK